MEYKHTNDDDDEKAAYRVCRRQILPTFKAPFCRLPAVRSGVAQWLAEMQTQEVVSVR